MIRTTEKKPKKKWSIEETLEIICNNTIETNWVVAAIAKKLDLDVDAIIDAEANPQ